MSSTNGTIRRLVGEDRKQAGALRREKARMKHERELRLAELAARRELVAGRVRRSITVGAGCGMPVLSLALSSIGGRLLCDGSYVLGTAMLGLCCTVLAVSLSHLAWAIGDITRSKAWQSWCLAIACDLSLVLCELCGVCGFSHWAVPCVMSAVTLSSALLNCWAFLCHE